MFLRERQQIGSECSRRLMVVRRAFPIAKLRQKLYFYRVSAGLGQIAKPFGGSLGNIYGSMTR